MDADNAAIGTFPDMNIFRLTSALILAFALSLTPSIPSWASDAALIKNGSVKINLAGRQRMLTQRMAKAVCFAAIGVMPEAHMDMMREAYDLFDKTLTGLREGDEEQGLLAENNPIILEELSFVEALWAQYGAAVRTAKSGPSGAVIALTGVAQLNLPTLRQMNKTVGEFEAFYGRAGVKHPSLALAINVSGRQRMLSQKAAKEFCLVAASKNVSENRKALAGTVSLFDTSLEAMLFGNEELGIAEAPTEEIREQLRRVKEIWEPIKAIFETSIQGGYVSPEDMQAVAEGNNVLLVEANKAVQMYVGL